MQPPIHTVLEGFLGLVHDNDPQPRSWLLRAHLDEPCSEGRTDVYLVPECTRLEPWEPELGELLAAFSADACTRIAKRTPLPGPVRELLAVLTGFRLEVAGLPAATYARCVAKSPDGRTRWLVVENIVDHAIYGEEFLSGPSNNGGCVTGPVPPG